MMRSIVQALLLFVLLTGGASAAEKPILIRFSHVVSAEGPKGIGAELIKQRVEERLAGRVKVEVYPDSELYTDEQVLLALLTGDVQMAAPSLSKFGNVTKHLQVFDLPFLFDDIDAVHRFQSSETGRGLLDSMLDKGIKGLAYWDNGMRVVSATKALRTPEDAAGLKFRIESSNVFQAQYKAVDVLPLKLPFKEVYDALQSGLVDGQENSWSNIASRRFYELGQQFTDTEHSYQGYAVVTSVKFWESLPPDVRAELEAIVAEVSKEVYQIALEKAKSGRQSVLNAGTSVIELSRSEKDAWIGQWRPVWTQFEESIGKDIVAGAMAANQK